MWIFGIFKSFLFILYISSPFFLNFIHHHLLLVNRYYLLVKIAVFVYGIIMGVYELKYFLVYLLFFFCALYWMNFSFKNSPRRKRRRTFRICYFLSERNACVWREQRIVMHKLYNRCFKILFDNALYG